LNEREDENHPLVAPTRKTSSLSITLACCDNYKNLLSPLLLKDVLQVRGI